MINFCAYGKDWKELFTFGSGSLQHTHIMEMLRTGNAQKHFQFPTPLVAAKIVT